MIQVVLKSFCLKVILIWIHFPASTPFPQADEILNSAIDEQVISDAVNAVGEALDTLKDNVDAKDIMAGLDEVKNFDINNKTGIDQNYIDTTVKSVDTFLKIKHGEGKETLEGIQKVNVNI